MGPLLPYLSLFFAGIALLFSALNLRRGQRDDYISELEHRLALAATDLATRTKERDDATAEIGRLRAMNLDLTARLLRLGGGGPLP